MTARPDPEAVLAEMRQNGMTGEQALITRDLVEHGVRKALEAVRDVGRVAPPDIRAVVARSIIGSLAMELNTLDPLAVAAGLRQSGKGEGFTHLDPGLARAP